MYFVVSLKFDNWLTKYLLTLVMMTTRNHFVCLGLIRGEQVVENNLRANQSGLDPRTKTKISTSFGFSFVFVFVFIILMYFVTLDCKQRPLSHSPNFTLAFYEVPKKKIATTSIMKVNIRELKKYKIQL